MRFQQQHDCTIRGLNYRLRMDGPTDAPAVLLLHGLLDTGASYAPLAEALARLGGARLRLIAPDWRGHGDSGAAKDGYWFPDYLADLDALIDHLGLALPVMLVGHSMGGQVASLYAGARPDAVSHLVTLDSLNVPDASPGATPQRYRRWLNDLQRPPAARTYDSLAAVAERIGKRYPELDDATRGFLAETWARPAGDGRFRLAFDERHRTPFPYGFRLDEAKALWRKVRAATLCLDAANSPVTHSITSQGMAERRACFAHMRHETLPDCGHMLHLQAPDAVARAILRFIQSA